MTLLGRKFRRWVVLCPKNPFASASGGKSSIFGVGPGQIFEVLRQGSQFEIKVPKRATAKAMEAADRGRGKRYKSAAALFKEIGI